ncbi:hypothetical protein [Streptomyces sp. NPDC002758]
MTDQPTTDRVTAIYDAIDAFQRQHRTGGGLQHAQIRALLAEHLDQTLPTAPVPVSVPADGQRRDVRDRIAHALEREDAIHWGYDHGFCDEYGVDPETDGFVDAVLAVADAEQAADLVTALRGAGAERDKIEARRYKQERAAALRKAADDLEAWQPEFSERWAVAERQRYEDGVDAAADRLRRMADEEQPACAASTSGHCLAEAQSETACDTDAGECVHGGRPADEEQPAAVACPQCRDTGACNGGPCPLLPQQYANEAHKPEHTWKVESPRRDNWASWGATYDERGWAQERYESAIENAPGRPFRLVRATTTFTVEAEQPATVARHADCPHGEGPGDGSGCIKPAGHDGDHVVTSGVQVIPCGRAVLHQPHIPHAWWPQPGMAYVHCPGASATEES